MAWGRVAGYQPGLWGACLELGTTEPRGRPPGPHPVAMWGSWEGRLQAPHGAGRPRRCPDGGVRGTPSVGRDQACRKVGAAWSARLPSPRLPASRCGGQRPRGAGWEEGRPRVTSHLHPQGQDLGTQWTAPSRALGRFWPLPSRRSHGASVRTSEEPLAQLWPLLDVAGAPRHADLGILGASKGGQPRFSLQLDGGRAGGRWGRTVPAAGPPQAGWAWGTGDAGGHFGANEATVSEKVTRCDE